MTSSGIRSFKRASSLKCLSTSSSLKSALNLSATIWMTGMNLGRSTIQWYVSRSNLCRAIPDRSILVTLQCGRVKASPNISNPPNWHNLLNRNERTNRIDLAAAAWVSESWPCAAWAVTPVRPVVHRYSSEHNSASYGMLRDHPDYPSQLASGDPS